eukprot:scaffold46633_cov19-Prasinocladus_malaysianus.AAC.1
MGAPQHHITTTASSIRRIAAEFAMSTWVGNQTAIINKSEHACAATYDRSMQRPPPGRRLWHRVV